MPSNPKPTRSVAARGFRVPIIAQDPSVGGSDGVLLGDVDVPNESCAPGPRGARIHVVDYDATSNQFYDPIAAPSFGDERTLKALRKLLSDPAQLERRRELHCVNAYATVMAVLGRFEQAMGRRIAWGFGEYGGHQIHLVPHAFAEANAYYSEDDRALMFGYFPSGHGASSRMVFTCLSHDILAHEATHALLDGLRTRYTDPSSPDQAAFHEAFADIVALLSIFSMRNVVEALLKSERRGKPMVHAKDFDGAWLRESPLLAMAEQFGRALEDTPHRRALRLSLLLKPSRAHYADMAEFGEPHRRAEILVAATLRAFVAMWKRALWGTRVAPKHPIPLDVVVTEGCDLAERLLTMVIRAIDYAPVVDIHFSDFLTALVTADRELFPRDDKYDARNLLIDHYAAYGILPVSGGDGVWDPTVDHLRYDHIHTDVLRHDPNEVFRFLWENRGPLDLDDQAYTRVLSVRPCTRRGPDGFWLHETVCEYVQILRLEARELKKIRLTSCGSGKRTEPLNRPEGLEDTDEVTLNGGGVLLFDEFGRLKYHINSRVRSWRQNNRLQALATSGSLLSSRAGRRHFANLHHAAAAPWPRAGLFRPPRSTTEAW